MIDLTKGMTTYTLSEAELTAIRANKPPPKYSDYYTTARRSFGNVGGSRRHYDRPKWEKVK